MTKACEASPPAQLIRNKTWAFMVQRLSEETGIQPKYLYRTVKGKYDSG